MVAVWQLEQAQRCPSCGTFDWEQEEDPEGWTAGIHWCLACRSVELLKERTVREAQHTEGYKVRLYRGGDLNGD